MNKFTFR